MPVNDPVMAALDKLSLASSSDTISDQAEVAPDGPAPFGLRFARTPIIPCDKHKRTYYTVTVREATQVNQDGKVVTVQDNVQQERED